MENLDKKKQELEFKRQEIEETDKKINDFQQEQLEKKNQMANQRKLLASAYEEKMNEKYTGNLYQKTKDREIYQNLCDRYAAKEIQKDMNYQNFYREVLNKQSSLQDLHKEKVFSPQIAKKNYLDSIVEKDIAENDIKMQQIENNKLNNYYKNLSEMTYNNRSKIYETESMRSQKSELRKLQDEQRMRELNEYNEFLNMEKEKKRNVQFNYQQDLIKQTHEQKTMKSMSVSMNPLEKRLNYYDLQAYKGSDPTLHSMIPGWSPQIGGMPKNVHQKNIVAKSLQIKTEPDENSEKTEKVIAFSPKIYQQYMENLEKSKQINNKNYSGDIDHNFLSKRQLEQMILYKQKQNNNINNNNNSIMNNNNNPHNYINIQSPTNFRNDDFSQKANAAYYNNIKSPTKNNNVNGNIFSTAGQNLIQ